MAYAPGGMAYPPGTAMYPPGAMVFPAPNSGVWTTGYCGCFEHCESCVCAWCCPCVLVGRIVEIVDLGATSCGAGCMLYCCIQSLTGCGWLYTCSYRARLRQKYGLPDSPCGDCCSDCCCPVCSIAQQYRELVNRGIDPSAGYIANMERMGGGGYPAGQYAAPPQAQPMQKY